MQHNFYQFNNLKRLLPHQGDKILRCTSYFACVETADSYFDDNSVDMS